MGYEVIQKANDEFARHVSSGDGGEFGLSQEASASLSQLTRQLENQRQLGSLTREEKESLREIDQFWEKIAKYNERKDLRGSTGGELVYNLQQSKLVTPEEHKQPPVIPNISSQEAEKIIAGLNQQFEEKVLSKLKEPAPAAGRNLQDYLQVIKSEGL